MRLYKEFPRIHNAGHSKEKRCSVGMNHPHPTNSKEVLTLNLLNMSNLVCVAFLNRTISLSCLISCCFPLSQLTLFCDHVSCHIISLYRLCRTTLHCPKYCDCCDKHKSTFNHERHKNTGRDVTNYCACHMCGSEHEIGWNKHCEVWARQVAKKDQGTFLIQERLAVLSVQKL